MPTKTKEKTSFTLGTMEDIGVLGLTLNVVAAMMRAAERAVHKTCRVCQRKMTAVITTDTAPNTRRAMKAENRATADYAICDECWSKNQPTISPVTLDLEKPLHERVLLWMACGDTGCSSETLVQRLSGIVNPKNTDPNHPYDRADFGRCVRALEALPELRTRLHDAEDLSSTWALIIQKWDHLETLYRSNDSQDKRSCDQAISEILKNIKQTDETARI